MELEINEPSIYFETDAKSAARFSDAVESYIT